MRPRHHRLARRLQDDPELMRCRRRSLRQRQPPGDPKRLLGEPLDGRWT
jgi:hypothetical protein